MIIPLWIIQVWKVLEIPAGPYSGLREAAHLLCPELSACQVAPAKACLFGRPPPGLLVWPLPDSSLHLLFLSLGKQTRLELEE